MFRLPAPPRYTPPPSCPAELPVTTALRKLRISTAEIAPPLPVVLPPVSVNPAISTLISRSPGASIEKIRELFSPLITTRSAPRPLIFKGAVMLISPDVRAIGIESSVKTDRSNAIVSVPRVALARSIASLRLPAPESSKLETKITAGAMRGSIDSRKYWEFILQQ